MHFFVLLNKNEDILKKVCDQAVLGTIDHPYWGKKQNTMEVNVAPELLCFPHTSEYLYLCSAEDRHSYRFGTSWGWVNDDRIVIFWVNYPFVNFFVSQFTLAALHDFDSLKRTTQEWFINESYYTGWAVWFWFTKRNSLLRIICSNTFN